ncbi:MAG: L,D-transpeptidase [Solirubrobacterales bacterium]|nr:L,D-transpeptidase [Solirubrobacterales bacterium]
MKTPFGSPQVLWVVRQAPGWLGVISPIVGNGRVGWIPRPAASLRRTTWELLVSLSSRRLTVIDHGQVLERYTVAIGAPSSPTPTGRFAVTDRLVTRNPAGPYGCCIVALSAVAPHAIQGWDGGDRIAIHTTPGNVGLGEAVTHGCMHVTMADGRWLLYHVPLGTPTLISA